MKQQCIQDFIRKEAVPEEVKSILASNRELVILRDARGCSLLHYVAGKRSKKSITELLIAAGAEVDARNDLGQTPLHWTAWSGNIRTQQGWSQYATQLVSNVQRSIRKLSDISRLRFLLYPSRLKQEDATKIRQDDEGVVWL